MLLVHCHDITDWDNEKEDSMNTLPPKGASSITFTEMLARKLVMAQLYARQKTSAQLAAANGVGRPWVFCASECFYDTEDYQYPEPE